MVEPGEGEPEPGVFKELRVFESPFGPRTSTKKITVTLGNPVALEIEDGKGNGAKVSVKLRMDDAVSWTTARWPELESQLEEAWKKSERWLVRLPEHAHLMTLRESDAGAEAVWRVVARLADCAWRVVQRQAAAGDGEARLRLPGFERLRFVALSHPLREQGLGWTLERHPFGDSEADLVFLVHEAWRVWAERLIAHRDHPWLAYHPELESEARIVLTRLEMRDSEELENRTRALQRQLSDRVTREFHLRRLAVGPATRALVGVTGWKAATFFLGLPMAGLLLAATLVLFGCLTAATQIAGVSYALASVCALFGGGWVTYPLCLRLAAGAALGAGAFTIEELQPDTTVIWPPLLVAVAAVGYLVFQASVLSPPATFPQGRQQKASKVSSVGKRFMAWATRFARPARSVGRALLVAGIGALHAIVISAIALTWISPNIGRAFGLSGDLSATTTDVLYLAAFGFALGVFLQIVWDEKPVTYPLVHA